MGFLDTPEPFKHTYLDWIEGLKETRIEFTYRLGLILA